MCTFFCLFEQIQLFERRLLLNDNEEKEEESKQARRKLDPRLLSLPLFLIAMLPSSMDDWRSAPSCKQARQQTEK